MLLGAPSTHPLDGALESLVTPMRRFTLILGAFFLVGALAILVAGFWGVARGTTRWADVHAPVLFSVFMILAGLRCLNPQFAPPGRRQQSRDSASRKV